jgi:hypothetical protein
VLVKLEVVDVKVPLSVPEKLNSPVSPEPVSVIFNFMLKGVLNESGGSAAELVVVSVAPGMKVGVDEPSSLEAVPSPARAKVTAPVPLGNTGEGIMLQL